MTKNYIFYYENPNDCRIVKITSEEIQEVAEACGDLTAPDAMDDKTFYEYCDVIVAHK